VVCLIMDRRGFRTPRESESMARLKHIYADKYPYFITTRTASGKQVFSNEKNAEILLSAIYFGREKGWYQLLSFVIMPDHLHLIVIPAEKNVSQIMKSIKGFASRAINLEGRSGVPLWQEGFYDYAIDGVKKLITKIRYVEENPVRKGLAFKVEDYRFSSAGGSNDTDLVSSL